MGEEAGPPGPRGFLIEASSNIVVKAGSVRVCLLPSSPSRQGDCLLLYAKGRQFTGVPRCANYVWRYGAQCCRVDGRPGKSFFWQIVVACPVSVQGWL
jgi:hypothetical protein